MKNEHLIELNGQLQQLVNSGFTLEEIRQMAPVPEAQLNQWIERYRKEQEGYKRQALSQSHQASYAMKFYRPSC